MKSRDNFTARKRFGQHFLQDSHVINTLINVIDPKPNDAVIEIGPGLGALTLPLLSILHHLDVVEIDRDLAAKLPSLVPDPAKLTIHCADILDFSLNTCFHGQKLRIIGNLPYNISTPCIFALLKFADIIQDMHFMLQAEVVARICAKPHSKEYGRLSIMTQYFCETEKLFSVPKEAFRPAPKVNSTILRLIPRAALLKTNVPLLQEITREAFTKRRKTLSNALKAYLHAEDFVALHIDPQLRPEALSVEDFVHITNYLFEKRHKQ